MTQTLPDHASSRVITTEELQALVAAGHRVRLPKVRRPSEDVLEHYSEQDRAALENQVVGDEVVAVEHVRDELVQCIAVDHDRHLYLTDGFIPTHNTSNIVFLKSTDDSMIETLQKMSGIRHVAYKDSKTVTKDTERLVKGLNVEGKVSYTIATKEEPVISYNDMAFISERNSIVFRAGDAPVWNRNETILPMSWKMFGGSGDESIIHPGHEYSLQTIPTLSSALDFDVRMNQPDFGKMLAKRMEQAILSKDAAVKYQKAYGYSDLDVTRLDPDVYSEQVMELVDAQMREEFALGTGTDPDEVDPEEMENMLDMLGLIGDADEDAEMRAIRREQEAKEAEFTKKRYASGQISRDMLVHRDDRQVRRGLEREIVDAYLACRPALERDGHHFRADSSGSLRSADGSTVYISKADEDRVLEHLSESADSEQDRVFAENSEAIKGLISHQVHDEFFRFLAKLPSWLDLAGGEFDNRMAMLMRAKEEDELL